jgi:20S proteasome subunit alpha 6
MFQVDQHMGLVISGIVGDGRALVQYMRDECLNHRYV